MAEFQFKHPIEFLAINQNETVCLSMNDGHVSILDLESGQTKMEIVENYQSAGIVSPIEKHDWSISVGRRFEFSYYDYRTKSLPSDRGILDIARKRHVVQSIALDSDCHTLAVASASPSTSWPTMTRIKMVDLRFMKGSHTEHKMLRASRVTSMEFLGDKLVVGNTRGGVQLYDILRLDPVWTSYVNDNIDKVGVLDDGYFYTISHEKNIAVYHSTKDSVDFVCDNFARGFEPNIYGIKQNFVVGLMKGIDSEYPYTVIHGKKNEQPLYWSAVSNSGIPEFKPIVSYKGHRGKVTAFVATKDYCITGGADGKLAIQPTELTFREIQGIEGKNYIRVGENDIMEWDGYEETVVKREIEEEPMDEEMVTTSLHGSSSDAEQGVKSDFTIALQNEPTEQRRFIRGGNQVENGSSGGVVANMAPQPDSADALQNGLTEQRRFTRGGNASSGGVVADMAPDLTIAFQNGPVEKRCFTRGGNSSSGGVVAEMAPQPDSANALQNGPVEKRRFTRGGNLVENASSDGVVADIAPQPNSANALQNGPVEKRRFTRGAGQHQYGSSSGNRVNEAGPSQPNPTSSVQRAAKTTENRPMRGAVRTAARRSSGNGKAGSSQPNPTSSVQRAAKTAEMKKRSSAQSGSVGTARPTTRSTETLAGRIKREARKRNEPASSRGGRK